MISTQITFDVKSQSDFRKFLQKEYYEPFLLDLLNRFKKFNHDIVQIENQSHGEYDFISESSNETFEATLLVTSEIVKGFISNPKICLEDKFAEWIYNDAKINILERLVKKKNKNTIILFNIFPMRNPRFSMGIFAQFASDAWDIIINEIIGEHSELINNKTIYLVSYNHDDKFLLKQMFPKIFYNEFISFDDKKDIFPIRVKSLQINTV